MKVVGTIKNHNYDCPDKPDGVDIYKYVNDNWTMEVCSHTYVGCDEEISCGLSTRIPVRYCPFCGKELL